MATLQDRVNRLSQFMSPAVDAVGGVLRGDDGLSPLGTLLRTAPAVVSATQSGQPPTTQTNATTAKPTPALQPVTVSAKRKPGGTHPDQAQIDAFNAKSATEGRGYGANTGNIVPSEFFTGGVRPQGPGVGLPQPRNAGGGGGQVHVIRDAEGALTPGSRMFDPVAFRAQLAQDQVQAQRDVANINAEAGLSETDLAGQYGVLGSQADAAIAQQEIQAGLAGDELDHRRNVELEQLKAEIQQGSPYGQQATAQAASILRRMQLENQLLAEGQITGAQALGVAPPRVQDSEVITNAAGIPIGIFENGRARALSEEEILAFAEANQMSQGSR